MPEIEDLFDEEEFEEQIEEPTPLSVLTGAAHKRPNKSLKGLLPQQEGRLEVLWFFAQAILKCHEQGESKWGITLYPNSVALNISGFYACWIRTADVFVSVVEAALTPEAWAKLSDKVEWKAFFKRLPEARSVYVPYAQVS